MARTRLEIPSSFPFAVEMPVRISDINYGGHLGNDAVLSLLQEARIHYLRLHGYSEKDVDGVGLIMTDAVILYRAEAFHGDRLRIEIAVGNCEAHGCDFYYRATNMASGKEVVRAKTGVAFFDYERRRVAEVPPRFKQLYCA
jgi:acyl-CoA thioesterase FadM